MGRSVRPKPPVIIVKADDVVLAEIVAALDLNGHQGNRTSVLDPMGGTMVEQAFPLASHAHVLELQGLAVDPARQRCGAGRRLVEASVEQARRRGARKLALRVLGSNVRARRLYESCGFLVEGVLHAEFFLGGRYVDDVLMARLLIAD